MRQVFFTLIGVNLLILGWGLLFAEDSSRRGMAASGANASQNSVVKIVPKSVDQSSREREEQSDVKYDDLKGGGVNEAPQNAVGARVDAQQLCEIVGPFAVGSEAAAFMERLQAIDVSSTMHELELSVGSNYWVLLPPKSSRKEAQVELKKLQSLGVDSYVVPKGDYANAISLGMFTKKQLADAVVDNLKSKRYEPTLKVIDRTQVEIWVMVSPKDVDNMSDLTWKRVMKELNKQERRQNFCLDVASDENIQ